MNADCHRLRWRCVFIMSASFLLAGCNRGPQLYPVSGKLTLEGQPVDGAAITMIPNVGGRHSSAVTDAEGSFVIGTFGPDDGALEGDYKVLVTKVKTIKPGNDRAGIMPVVESITPERYDNPDTTDLTLTVTKGMEPVVWDLTP